MSGFFFLLILLGFQARTEVVFLDLNDAPEEIRHCRAGIDAGNAKKLWQQPEQLHVVKPGEYQLDRKNGETTLKSKSYYALRAKFTEMTRRNIPIDSIVISGDDGTGEFTGSKGNFTYLELRELVKEFPQAAKGLQSAALWGCYTTTVDATDQYWLNKIPGMKVTMGFTVQGPSKTREANHRLLKQFCERRKEAAAMASKDELCDFYKGLDRITRTSVAICNKYGTANEEYADGGESCFTYDELKKRCPKFVNDRRLEDAYRAYMSGEREPPPEKPGELTDLRRYYNEVQKWRHCAAQYKQNRGSDLPSAASMIRLIKFKAIKNALADLNSDELEDYDQMLSQAGLDQYRLGDIRKLTRKQMIDKIMGAVSTLESQKSETPVRQPSAACRPGGLIDGCEGKPRVPKTDIAYGNRTLLRMAQCMRQTFVNLNSDCSPFDNIGDQPDTASPCILTPSEAAGERHEDDAC